MGGVSLLLPLTARPPPPQGPWRDRDLWAQSGLSDAHLWEALCEDRCLRLWPGLPDRVYLGHVCVTASLEGDGVG